jgi:5-(carboxyamino)imidazole ribonucleotide mutase
MPSKIAQKSGKKPLVGLIMGSQSDWATMEHSAALLKSFGIGFEVAITSAHRTPRRLYAYASSARRRGLQVIIAGAGGAAHLPGMAASLTTLPVFGVPVQSKSLNGLDSLLSIAQMPAGIPVGTLAIGEAGAKNAALLAIAVLALRDQTLAKKLVVWRAAQTASVAKKPKKDSKRK